MDDGEPTPVPSPESYKDKMKSYFHKYKYGLLGIGIYGASWIGDRYLPEKHKDTMIKHTMFATFAGGLGYLGKCFVETHKGKRYRQVFVFDTSPSDETIEIVD